MDDIPVLDEVFWGAWEFEEGWGIACHLVCRPEIFLNMASEKLVNRPSGENKAEITGSIVAFFKLPERCVAAVAEKCDNGWDGMALQALVLIGLESLIGHWMKELTWTFQAP